MQYFDIIQFCKDKTNLIPSLSVDDYNPTFRHFEAWEANDAFMNTTETALVWPIIGLDEPINENATVKPKKSHINA